MKYEFKAIKLLEHVWSIEGDGCCCYLVEGNQTAMVIDTTFSTGNIRKFAQTLTDIPVHYAINTHGHFDHTGGNGYFDLVFMHENGMKDGRTPYPSLNPKDYILDYPIATIKDQSKLELGNYELEIIEIPSHSPSSVAILDKTSRILFTGDEVSTIPVALIYMQDDPQPTIEDYLAHLMKLKGFENQFDYVCSGHTTDLIDKTIIDEYIENCKQIMAGKLGSTDVMPENPPEDFHMPLIEYKRLSTYKRSSLMYDIRYIFNDKEQTL